MKPTVRLSNAVKSVSLTSTVKLSAAYRYAATVTVKMKVAAQRLTFAAAAIARRICP